MELDRRIKTTEVITVKKESALAGCCPTCQVLQLRVWEGSGAVLVQNSDG